MNLYQQCEKKFRTGHPIYPKSVPKENLWNVLITCGENGFAMKVRDGTCEVQQIERTAFFFFLVFRNLPVVGQLSFSLFFIWLNLETLKSYLLVALFWYNTHLTTYISKFWNSIMFVTYICCNAERINVSSRYVSMHYCFRHSIFVVLSNTYMYVPRYIWKTRMLVSTQLVGIYHKCFPNTDWLLDARWVFN